MAISGGVSDRSLRVLYKRGDNGRRRKLLRLTNKRNEVCFKVEQADDGLQRPNAVIDVRRAVTLARVG